MDAGSKLLQKTLVASTERQQEADSDREVVRKVQAGDVAAFDRLILKYRERVYGVVYNMTSNREDAADLVQDSFIKAFQSGSSLESSCRGGRRDHPAFSVRRSQRGARPRD